MEPAAYAVTYRQAYPLQPREVVRHAAVSTLAGLAGLTGAVERALAVPRLQFLYLHHVFQDEEAGFRGLLRALSATHRFLSYSEAVDRLRGGPIDAPAVAFSFDDGLRNCLRAAAILEEFGARGCFFLCPSVVGETSFTRLADFCRHRLHKPPLEFLSWQEAEALRRAGHEIGSHTMSHANLAAVSPAELAEEVGRSQEVLRARLGPVPHFAWPYGHFSHFSPAAARAVFAAGFDSCSSAERGCHAAPAGRPHPCVRRDLVIARWPLAHVHWFLARNARRPSAPGWPPGWRVD